MSLPDRYRYDPPDRLSRLVSLPGFTGALCDPLTGHYLLGHGYRAFNPVLMRFNSPDSLSPFDAGGLNAYAYCKGDPVNYWDLTGSVRTKLLKNPLLNQLLARPAAAHVPAAGTRGLSPRAREISRVGPRAPELPSSTRMDVAPSDLQMPGNRPSAGANTPLQGVASPTAQPANLESLTPTARYEIQGGAFTIYNSQEVLALPVAERFFCTVLMLLPL